MNIDQLRKSNKGRAIKIDRTDRGQGGGVGRRRKMLDEQKCIYVNLVK